MLTEQELLKVYALLDRGMVEGDCGERCASFCCTAATTKYLLPGEEEYFRRHHPHVPAVRKPWYTQVFQTECCCVREHRMFACRAFPFRPVLDRTTRRVTGVVKADNPLFEPCWIGRADPDWERRAVEAWTIVLGDADNRRLYGRIQYLSDLLHRMGDEYYQLPADSVERFMGDAVASASEEELQALLFDFFPTA